MANQLTMDKAFAMGILQTAGYSERRIAPTARHLTGSRWAAFAAAPAKQYHGANGDQQPSANRVRRRIARKTPHAPVTSGSQCEPLRQIVIAKWVLGLSARRIDQNMVADHGFDGKFWSVIRFVKSLGECNGDPGPVPAPQRK